MAAPKVATKTRGVYRRGSRYVVIFRDREGKQRERTTGTHGAAGRPRARRTAELEDDAQPVGGRVPLGEYAREWVERYQGKGRRGFREQTRADYRRDLERYVIPFLE